MNVALVNPPVAGLRRLMPFGEGKTGVSVRCWCSDALWRALIVSTIASGHFEGGYGWEEGSEEAVLVRR